MVGSETVVPLGPKGSHHLRVGWFPVLRLFLPDLFNDAPLRLWDCLTGYLLKPVAGIFPVTTGVLLDELPDAGKVEGDGGAVHGGLFELKSV